MNLVLNEEIDQWHYRAKKQSCKYFSIFHSSRVVPAEGEAPQSPRDCGNKIRYHENIVPIVIVCRCDICPTPTAERSEQSNSSYPFR